MKYLLILTSIIWGYTSYDCNPGDINYGIYSLEYPKVDSVVKVSETKQLVYTKDSIYTQYFNTELKNILILKDKRDSLLFSWVVDSVRYVDTTSFVNTNGIYLLGKIDKMFKGDDSIIGKRTGTKWTTYNTGGRKFSDYGRSYFESLKGKRLIDWGWIEEWQGAISIISRMEILNNCRGFDHYWYFGNGDTLWNNSQYGVPATITSLVDSINALKTSPIKNEVLSNINTIDISLVNIQGKVLKSIRNSKLNPLEWANSLDLKVGSYFIKYLKNGELISIPFKVK